MVFTNTKREPMKTDFNSLRLRGQRVAIAKDVIAQIECKNLSVQSWVYVSSSLRGGERLPIVDRNETATEKYVDVITQSCSVCALGSLLLSRCRIGSPMPLDALGYEEDDVKRGTVEADRTDCGLSLGDMFDSDPLDEVAGCFEGWVKESDKKKWVGRDWFHGFPCHEDRLLAIMQNIVDNDGTFVPEDSDYEIVRI